MERTNIKWNIVEEIAETVFPADYEMVSRNQIEDFERRISKGLSPVEHGQSAGGMHLDFAEAANYFGLLLSAISLIYSWYTYNHPKDQKTDYVAFLDYLSNHLEEKHLFDDFLTKEVKRMIEREFDQIISELKKRILQETSNS